MTPTQNDPVRETSWTIGERAAGKRLGKFGSASKRSPVREAVALAETGAR